MTSYEPCPQCGSTGIEMVAMMGRHSRVYAACVDCHYMVGLDLRLPCTSDEVERAWDELCRSTGPEDWKELGMNDGNERNKEE